MRSSHYQTGFRLFLSAFSLLLLPGCLGINWNDPNSIRNAIRVEDDPFSQTTKFVGPNAAADQIADGLVIRAWKTRNGAITYQIYIEDDYTHPIREGGLGWRYYSEASDSDGNQLPTTVLSRDLRRCGHNVCFYVEVVGVEIDRKYLEERQTRGIRLKISGTNEKEIVWIPPAYVQAFLSVTQ